MFYCFIIIYYCQVASRFGYGYIDFFFFCQKFYFICWFINCNGIFKVYLIKFIVVIFICFVKQFNQYILIYSNINWVCLEIEMLLISILFVIVLILRICEKYQVIFYGYCSVYIFLLWIYMLYFFYRYVQFSIFFVIFDQGYNDSFFFFFLKFVY